MLVQLLLLVLLHHQPASSHPGGFSGGRGSCGTEYGSVDQAFDVVDIAEAWYVRRIATCASPFLWSTWETTADNQKVYIAGNIPEIKRFNDNLEFHGVLFGPGLPIPITPNPILANNKISFPESFQGILLGQRTLSPPTTKYDNCELVASNSVMSQYAKVKDGRCTETITLDDDYKNPLVAGLEYSSEWLYSFNHKMALKGRYFLVTWLEDRVTKKIATGKYDLTLAPWIWYRYADDDTTKKMQSQGSTCQCAFNTLEWREATLNRISNFPKEALIQALPKSTCSLEERSGGEEGTDNSVCAGAHGKDSLSSDSQVEWSGFFQLTPGSTYTWTFHATITCKNKICETTYPDPAIHILLAASTTLGKDVETAADAVLKEATSHNSVSDEGTIDIGVDPAANDGKATLPKKSILTMGTIPTNCGTSAPCPKTTSYKVILPTNAPKDYWMFTQHVPHEFSANFLTCTSGACLNKDNLKYVYPTQTSLYLGVSKYVNTWKDDMIAKVYKYNEESQTPSSSSFVRGDGGQKDAAAAMTMVLVAAGSVLAITLLFLACHFWCAQRRARRSEDFAPAAAGPITVTELTSTGIEKNVHEHANMKK